MVVAETTSTPVQQTRECDCRNCTELGPIRFTAPEDMEWKPVWALMKKSTQPSASSTPGNKTFDELILEKVKGPTEKQPKKIRKIDLMAKVITDDEYREAIRQREEDISAKTKGKKKKKKPEIDEDIDEELPLFDDADESNAEDLSEGENSESEQQDEELHVPASEEEASSYLKNVWKNFCPPTKEDDILNKWVGVIYHHKKRQQLYVGRIKKRFLQDDNGPAAALEVECLKPHVGSGTVLESTPIHLPDIGVFAIHNVISASLNVFPVSSNYRSSGKWNVPEYDSLKSIFDLVEKMNREEVHKGFLITFSKRENNI